MPQNTNKLYVLHKIYQNNIIRELIPTLRRTDKLL